MAMIETGPKAKTRTNYEHLFFSGLAALILVSVFIGFAPTFFLRGIVPIPALQRGHMSIAQPLPLLVVTHGVILSSWILLLITQTSLVAAHRVRLHQRLGVGGFILACIVVLAGLAVIPESLARNFPPGSPGIAFLASFLFLVLSFAVLVFFGYRERRNPAAHKRLMLLATVCLLPTAFARWPVWPGTSLTGDGVCCSALAGLVACYDLVSMRKISAATLWGGAVVLSVTGPLIILALAHNSTWFRFALLLQRFGRHLYQGG